MKKLLYLLFAGLSICLSAKAAPGDTTKVFANNVQLAWYGSYDSTVVFPHAGTSYRRIYMVFTLGKYVCGGSGYCGDWDYTVQNYLITPAGETFELGRLITPYANAGAPRTPWTWTQHYVYDVTDYVSKLQDTAKIRIFYSGYSGGFTGNIQFQFIEGTPDRSVLGIKRLWNGSFSYGDTTHGNANDINTHFTTLSQSAPAGTQAADMKFTVTGHGADPNYCSEFCKHNYQVMLNGSSVANRLIWRNDCGRNELSPQSGTWLYERGNWCPGAIVYSHHNMLPGITGGMSFNTAIQFDAYAANGGASYTTEATLIYYGGMNKNLDATLEDIVSPTLDENHYRENPICGKPIIHVRNTGALPITSLDITYGVAGAPIGTYTWTGSIASLDEMDITLPELFTLDAKSGLSGTYTFNAAITRVNGLIDEDTTNNKFQSQFQPTSLWPSTFRVSFKTNNEAIATGSTTSETSWVIYDMNHNIMAQRTNAAISTYYLDTITLSPGCYQFVMYDSSCNGLYWWANDASITSGYMNIKKLVGGNINLKGYQYSGTYAHDFGCGYSQYFYCSDWPAKVIEVSGTPAGMELYPNPAQNSFNIDFTGVQSIDGTVRVIDALGRTVISQPCHDLHTLVNTSMLNNGVYTIQFTDNSGNANKLNSRVVIAK